MTNDLLLLAGIVVGSFCTWLGMTIGRKHDRKHRN